VSEVSLKSIYIYVYEIKPVEALRRRKDGSRSFYVRALQRGIIYYIPCKQGGSL